VNKNKKSNAIIIQCAAQLTIAIFSMTAEIVNSFGRDLLSFVYMFVFTGIFATS
jgi:hypothetical protein